MRLLGKERQKKRRDARLRREDAEFEQYGRAVLARWRQAGHYLGYSWRLRRTRKRAVALGRALVTKDARRWMRRFGIKEETILDMKMIVRRKDGRYLRAETRVTCWLPPKGNGTGALFYVVTPEDGPDRRLLQGAQAGREHDVHVQGV